ncbi:MAG: ATP-binding cassette domain-containing protein, partial [Hyphomicrobiales bacterium]
GTHAKALVAFDNADVLTPNGAKLFNTGKVWLKRGDRVAILGGNGTGKSRLVSQIYKAISEHETPDNAQNIFAAPSLVLGYCDQEQSQLDVAASPIALITSEFDVGDQRARSLLAGAGFSIDLQSASMQALSGGQRMRLAMLLLRLTNPNFYLLDEPTNHLDIEGQEALEIELKKHDASCLLVSHDRTFVRAVANRYWLIKGQDLVEIDGPEGFFDEALGL